VVLGVGSVSDIVERLRRAAGGRVSGEPSVMHEAADEIERLRRQCEGIAVMLKTALDEQDKLNTEIERLRAENERLDAGLLAA
jgi:hypothetical protein